MARIAGVDLPANKRAEIGLTYIYGIGRSRANKILGEAGISVDKRIRELSEEEVNRIRTVIDQQGGVEGDLRKQIQMDIKRLMDPYKDSRQQAAKARPNSHSTAGCETPKACASAYSSPPVRMPLRA